MSTLQIDHLSAGYVFVYEAETGEVLWTHEKIVEVTPVQGTRPNRLTEQEREQVRLDAAKVFKGRKIEALIAPDGYVRDENMQIFIDPKRKTLSETPIEMPSLADRFAEFGGEDDGNS